MIHIKYFGAIAEVTNCTSEKLESKTYSLKEIIQEINKKYELKHIPLKYALNQNIVDKVEGIEISENDEVAVLPPFAGG